MVKHVLGRLQGIGPAPSVIILVIGQRQNQHTLEYKVDDVALTDLGKAAEHLGEWVTLKIESGIVTNIKFEGA
jgi:hypothetical protein